MPVTLPVQKTTPNREWTKQTILLIGAGKIGKSALLAEGQRTFFFDFEGGLSHLATLSYPCRSWGEFIEICGELYKANRDGKFPYDTLVIDTVDKMVDRAYEETIGLAKEKFKSIADRINTIGDIPEGQGWYVGQTLVMAALDKLRQFPACLVLVSHIASKEMTDGVRKWNKDTITIGGQMGTKIIHRVDHTLHIQARMNGDRIERVIRTKPTQAIEAGSRGNVVPDGLKWTENNAENYKQLRALFT